MKKIASIITLFVLCGTVFFTFISAGSEEKEDKVTITFVTPLVAHPVWLKAKEGFEQAAEDLNFVPQWIGPQGLDVNEMVKQIEIAINLESDGIITQGLVPEALEPVLKMASDANIPVVLVDGDVPNAERLAFLGLSPTDFGNIGGGEIAKVMKGKAIVGAGIVPNVEHKIANDIIKSYINVLSSHPAGFEHTTIVESKSDTFTAVTRFEELLNSYPELNVFYCTGAETAPAAATVLREKGMSGDDVVIIGIDDIDETLDLIDEGYMHATLAVNFFRYGYQASQIILDYISTGAVPAKKVIDIPPILVTKDNLRTYGADIKKVETWQ